MLRKDLIRQLSDIERQLYVIRRGGVNSFAFMETRGGVGLVSQVYARMAG
jgi:hypothetical protein